MKGRKLTICLVSDFFCPNTGGVETHMYFLAQCLIARGHRVLVITHAYPGRLGPRLLSNSLKVYYLPFLVFYNGVILPTVFTTLPWIRYLLLKERVDLVHGHSSFSTLAHESLLHAAQLGIGTVFTDHSLFGFADASAILTNKLLAWSLSHTDAVVCVSHTSKENTVLRAGLPPAKVSVIPNAVHCPEFTPDPRLYAENPITVVVTSRLVYRKGTDLLAALIPEACAAFPQLRFIIAGDGPKRVLLEEVREGCGLQERVLMLGQVPHSQVRQVLVQGHIFLNTSLTEAFCMAIVEAAACGLHVITTKVGGIPEVLPPDLMSLAEPSADDLGRVLGQAIRRCQSQRRERRLPDPWQAHHRVAAMYNWPDVAERVEKVYQDVLKEPPLPMRAKLWRYFACGWGFGWFFVAVAAISAALLWLLQVFQPLPRPPYPSLSPSPIPATPSSQLRASNGDIHGRASNKSQFSNGSLAYSDSE